MITFAVIVLFLVFFGFRISKSNKSANQAWFPTSGVVARGLVLASSSYSQGVTINGRRFEKRTMTLDIEIPGVAPYVRSGDFLIPRGLVEAVPGASLDLSVDPLRPDQVAVLGPGGFSGPWIRVGIPAPY